MKILGIDYGRVKTGLAISEAGLVEPWKVIRTSEIEEVFGKGNFDKVVVGVSSGAMGEEQKRFARKIGAETFDETLTTKEAQRLSIEAGISQKRRKGMEDAFAASLMLQNYLDSKT